jgi:hypothetical protein
MNRLDLRRRLSLAWGGVIGRSEKRLTAAFWTSLSCLLNGRRTARGQQMRSTV